MTAAALWKTPMVTSWRTATLHFEMVSKASLKMIQHITRVMVEGWLEGDRIMQHSNVTDYSVS